MKRKTSKAAQKAKKPSGVVAKRKTATRSPKVAKSAKGQGSGRTQAVGKDAPIAPRTTESRESLFFLAVERLRTRGGQGNRSTVYRAPQSLLTEAAIAHVYDGESVRDLSARLADELTSYNVTAKSLERWLPLVRAEYRKVTTEHLRSQIIKGDLAIHTRDPMAVAGMTVNQLANALHARIGGIDIDKLDSKDANAITAMVAQVTKYAEVHANAEFLRARVRKIEAVLREGAQQLAGGAGSADGPDRRKRALNILLSALDRSGDEIQEGESA